MVPLLAVLLAGPGWAADPAADPAADAAADPAPASTRRRDRYEGLDADVDATGFVPAPPEQVFGYVIEMTHLRALFPTDCVGKLEYGDRTFGEGAAGFIRYDLGMMHRRLPVALTHAAAPEKVTYDHLGERGFLTTWTLAPRDGGTEVRIHTPLNAPPRPLKAYYFNVVRPEWERCYAEAVSALAKTLSTGTGG